MITRANCERMLATASNSGWVSGTVLDELLTNAMIFVLPSDLEGLSLALLDAMGAGLCVLASDVPENQGGNWRNGIHVSAGGRGRSGRTTAISDCESGGARGGR